MNTALIEVEGLVKYYAVPRQGLWESQQYVKAVDNVSFTIREGETFGLVGESGCGKSTTGQLLVRLLQQTGGSIRYRGRDVTGLDRREMRILRQEIQIVFQDPYASLNPKKQIGWILEEPLIIHRIGDKQERRKIVASVLEQVGLDNSFLKRYPHELSGGQRQRVGIAAALVLNPKFIVIDEAVSALDVSIQSQILNLLKELQHRHGLTYLFISHDLNVIQYMSDRIGVMYLGRLAEIIDVAQAGREPVHPYTQALFSSIPQVKATQRERILLQGDLPSPLTPPTGCTFHPRCPYAMDRCHQEMPELKPYSTGNMVSCHLYEGEEIK
ncbi:ABC transporter ATP-binding protein [Paenibacillus glucanolyticus]|jgi:oligopeptide/dipeptide ABC transporter ATP-binding protein|uniref:Dipeptide/oligopeptide/nickel ABC transporter ATP-binding protein n=2 Tax=Paenibacillus glucanolyticus TaxID=59843 RepID=A0A163MC72_9BACL|nr:MULTISPECIES: oligopeptide/dipeptide ABC transporter ATP-binding protein [Paenibacillus]MCA4750937.1 ATP-binding cassette domain-containing protein [Mycolicibacterium fortuitum]AVV58432.1 ABC transporter ATP-binding protein [Paenibacillus glucanolyticus]ETT40316.1 oligopeptide/dipeptide ABC transporter ATPase [Paenibacillus sp. FSL R5-808]KZS48924.1 dipeptide/oligopeptide/nickel ABC transporter ATP-binding protein [Paenibacillus glucanolyticus]MPY20318.1 ATP-binding cassette domain-containi